MLMHSVDIDASKVVREVHEFMDRRSLWEEEHEVESIVVEQVFEGLSIDRLTTKVNLGIRVIATACDGSVLCSHPSWVPSKDAVVIYRKGKV